MSRSWINSKSMRGTPSRLQAVLEAPHHAVVTLIEPVLELQTPAPEPMLEIFRIVDRSE